MKARTSGHEPEHDLAIVGTVGLPPRYGGFETLADQLTKGLQDRLRIAIFCTTKGRTDGYPARYMTSDLQYVAWDANGWQSILYDFVSMWRAAPKSGTLLVLGVSGCALLPIIRLRAARTRIVVNIDGLEWRRKKWSWLARWVLRVSEWCAVRFSDVVIADNKAIEDHVRNCYGAHATQIAYGGDQSLPATAVAPTADTRFAPGEYFLAICRIEPENNIEVILRAFSGIPNQQLVVVGNWNGSVYALKTRSRFDKYLNIELKDAIYDPARLASLRCGAKAYVHGHSAGGTNPSLVEAMSFGLAVAAYDVSYNRYTTGNEACYWLTSEDLAKLVTEATGDRLLRNARAMKALADREYRWDKIVEAYAAVITPKDAPGRTGVSNDLSRFGGSHEEGEALPSPRSPRP